MTDPATPTVRPPGGASDRPGGAPDHPSVPRPRMSRMAKVLGVFGALIVAGYAWIAYAEYEPGTPARDEIPASVRSSPGGYRSFHFWHSGYHGGK
jgi:hypothetical protein